MFGLGGLKIWLGDPASFEAAKLLEAKAVELNDPKVRAEYLAQEEASNKAGGERVPRLYSRQGSVGLISIKGPLINSDNWITEFLNMATYPAIQEAAAFAAADPAVDRVLLDIGSPGGSVQGLQATGDMLKQLGKAKPVYAYSDSTIGSAAYWLASTASKIWVNETTTVGSIGTVIVHSERSEQLKSEGTNVTVIRSGPFKMLGNNVEPLSEKAKAELQSLVDKNADLFKAEVGENRSLSAADVEKVAEGREYLGADALAGGLVDGLLSISEVFAEMKPKKKVDKLPDFNNNRSKPMRGSGMSGRTVLTQEALAAAIANGADPATLEAEALTPEQEAAAAAEQARIEAEAAAGAADTKVEPTTFAPDAKDGKIELLVTQLSSAQKDLMEMQVAFKTLEAKAASDLTSLEDLKKIAANSVSKMLVALKGPAMNLENFSAAEIVSRHAEISGEFAKQFKVGGVAVSLVSDEEDKQKAPTNVSSLQKARMNAAKAKIGSNK